jgi:hypothetical protein
MSFFNDEVEEGVALPAAAANALTEIRHRVRKLRCRLYNILSFNAYFSYRLDCDWFVSCGPAVGPGYH